MQGLLDGRAAVGNRFSHRFEHALSGLFSYGGNYEARNSFCCL
jgi:hypothetical protein